MHKDRLEKLASFLDVLPDEKFDFGTVVSENGEPMLKALKLGAVYCGTVACAIGWMPAVFPRSIAWRKRRSWDSTLNVAFKKRRTKINFEVAEEWFDLTSDQAEVLFAPYSSGYGLKPLSPSATPKTVARRIRTFMQHEHREQHS